MLKPATLEPFAKMPYTALARDTSPHPEQVYLASLRKAGMASRLAIASTHTKRMQQLSLSGFKRREGDDAAIWQKFARALLGTEGNFKLRGQPDMWAASDPFDLAGELHLILERLGINYFVTGGVAACCHGEPRATVDLDLVIQVEPVAINALGKALEDAGFYVPYINLENVANGIEKSLNIIHQEKCTKADLIATSQDPFDVSRMSRRELIEAGFYICSVEDTILKKLDWSRGSASEKQWRDVQTILRIQGGFLDLQYMGYWARILAVEEALQNALLEAGLS